MKLVHHSHALRALFGSIMVLCLTITVGCLDSDDESADFGGNPGTGARYSLDAVVAPDPASWPNLPQAIPALPADAGVFYRVDIQVTRFDDVPPEDTRAVISTTWRDSFFFTGVPGGDPSPLVQNPTPDGSTGQVQLDPNGQATVFIATQPVPGIQYVTVEYGSLLKRTQVVLNGETSNPIVEFVPLPGQPTRLRANGRDRLGLSLGLVFNTYDEFGNPTRQPFYDRDARHFVFVEDGCLVNEEGTEGCGENNFREWFSPVGYFYEAPVLPQGEQSRVITMVGAVRSTFFPGVTFQGGRAIEVVNIDYNNEDLFQKVAANTYDFTLQSFGPNPIPFSGETVTLELENATGFTINDSATSGQDGVIRIVLEPIANVDLRNSVNTGALRMTLELEGQSECCTGDETEEYLRFENLELDALLLSFNSLFTDNSIEITNQTEGRIFQFDVVVEDAVGRAVRNAWVRVDHSGVGGLAPDNGVTSEAHDGAFFDNLNSAQQTELDQTLGFSPNAGPNSPETQYILTDSLGRATVLFFGVGTPGQAQFQVGAYDPRPQREIIQTGSFTISFVDNE